VPSATLSGLQNQILQLTKENQELKEREAENRKRLEQLEKDVQWLKATLDGTTKK